MRKEVIVIACMILAILAAGCTSAPEAPQLTGEEKEMAISSIEKNSYVQDAAITQDGDKLSLALIVGYATNEATAKDLGDGFVRLVKSFGPEDAPQKEIGPGLYRYMVGVYYPNEEQVALGTKCPSCKNIRW